MSGTQDTEVVACHHGTAGCVVTVAHATEYCTDGTKENGHIRRLVPQQTKATEDAAEQAYRRIWTRENKKDADALWIEINRGRNLCAKAAEQMTKDGAEIERLRAENAELQSLLAGATRFNGGCCGR